MVLARRGDRRTLCASRNMGVLAHRNRRERDTTLVHGDFELVRRPIFTAMPVFSVGITLMTRSARVGRVRGCC